MGQFKPMVKMETNEPSVILKLKKGGHVNAKEDRKEEHGHKPMHEACDERYATGGSAPRKPSMMDRHRAMNPNFYKKGGDVERLEKDEKSDRKREAKMEKELKAHERKPAHLGHEGLKRGGVMRKAEGGSITSAMTKTTVKGDAKKFVSDMNTMEHGKRGSDKTGGVKLGNAGGYKDGGKVESSIHTAEHLDRTSGKTGDVKFGNAGGYKRGGKVSHKAEGGREPGVGNAIEGNEDRFANNNINDGEHPDHGPGKTGDVRLGNAGGYKKGGAAKKHYATGGEVQDDGKAVKMPRHFVSAPVANSLQSGTFKHGGHAKR